MSLLETLVENSDFIFLLSSPHPPTLPQTLKTIVFLSRALQTFCSDPHFSIDSLDEEIM